MRSREDASWVAHAIAWLGVRGRRVVVRTRVVMPKRVVAALTEAQELNAGVIVELEVAHHKPEVQRALLGDQADPAVALLLQAQHIETLEIPVVARIGPVMPGIHDQPNGFMPLVRNVEAADVRRVVVVVGQLHAQQIHNLVSCQRELTIAGLLELGRAYAVDAMILLGSVPAPADGAVYKLRARRAQVFAHALERIVTDLGLELPGCGCRSHCELVARPSTNGYAAGYESVMGRDLFAGLELR
ncbi:hypothetical protein [Enhygromyxa salina]|nr:hypothetical protein [Enhygromyxa salina]